MEVLVDGLSGKVEGGHLYRLGSSTAAGWARAAAGLLRAQSIIQKRQAAEKIQRR